MTGSPHIVPLGPGQDRAVGAMLARAFDADLMMIHLLPDGDQRERRLPRFMTATVRHCARYGRVRVAGDMAGAACWLAPGQTDLKVPRMIRSGMMAMPLRIGLDAFRRMLALTAPVEAAHHRLVPGPHWYLQVLGTDPDQQGKGLGGALIAEGNGWADEAGVPVYLETMKKRNVDYYPRFGFAVAEVIPHEQVTTWAMLRLAR